MRYSALSFSSANMQDWQKDLLVDALGEIGFDTFEDSQEGFVAYIPTANLDIQALETVLLYHTNDFEVTYEVKNLEEQNWNELWERNFNPIIIDDQCYVRATFHEDKPDYPYQIVIDPKMAFGTGHHQTTSMMLSYLLESEVEGMDVLDMGCGTGILAILASMRGAKSVLAVDNDDVCISSVAENTERNQVSNVRAILGSDDVLSGQSFDIILANINRNVLLEQMPQYVACLKNKGRLFVSGFYVGEDLDLLKQKAGDLGLVFENNKSLDTWCAARFVKT